MYRARVLIRIVCTAGGRGYGSQVTSCERWLISREILSCDQRCGFLVITYISRDYILTMRSLSSDRGGDKAAYGQTSKQAGWVGIKSTTSSHRCAPRLREATLGIRTSVTTDDGRRTRLLAPASSVFLPRWSVNSSVNSSLT